MSPLFKCKLWANNQYYWMRQVLPGEAEAFNKFMECSTYSNIFQTFAWGQFKSLHGWQPLYLLLEKNNNICATATILKRNTAGMTIFYSPRGPVLDYNQPHLLALFCRGVFLLAQQHKAIFWRIDPEVPRSSPVKGYYLTGLRPAPLNNPFGGIQPRWVWRVPLRKNSDKQWSLLKKGCRRQIKQAYKNKIIVREGTQEDLGSFYELLQATAQHNGFLLRSLSYYQDLWQCLTPGGSLKMLLAYYDQKPVSTALAVGYGQGVWDIYAGNNQAARQTGASYLLTWKLLLWAGKRGYSFYDLGGIVPQAGEENPLGGLELFKSRFGGTAVEFIGEHDLVFRPLYYKFWHLGQRSFQLAKNCRKKLKIF